MDQPIPTVNESKNDDDHADIEETPRVEAGKSLDVEISSKKDKEALENMPGYVKFMKYLVTRKRIVSYDPADNMHNYSAFASRLLVEKKKDPRAFTIPCTIGSFNIAQTLYDLRASINLISLVVFKWLGLGAPKPIWIKLLMANRIAKKPIGNLCNVLVEVASFIFPANFMIIDCESMQRPNDMRVVSMIGTIDNENDVMTILIEERLGVEALAMLIINFDSDGIKDITRWANNTLSVIITADLVDKEGIENQVADHLSILEEEAMQKIVDGLEIDDTFLDGQILAVSQDIIPWFTDFTNYLASDLIPEDLSFNQRKRFMHKVRKFFWGGPYLFRICADDIIRRCIPEVEMVITYCYYPAIMSCPIFVKVKQNMTRGL
ncbi:uncharacterized protein LOC124897574 [Capsicum annuum]|uniref:uncharacterized protein LOC124897574 n=1 Tax=Capsicum annuum TaxID=4072 RepID=UPI001FB0FA80|nr:uncharacterized protein LOC124897574 [Capsicum annuum]